jgi:hypothetical protein
MVKERAGAQQRARNAIINEWASWAVRAVLVTIGSYIVWQVRGAQTMQEDIAVIKNIVASHDKQIHDIWEHLGKKH